MLKDGSGEKRKLVDDRISEFGLKVRVGVGWIAPKQNFSNGSAAAFQPPETGLIFSGAAEDM